MEYFIEYDNRYRHAILGFIRGSIQDRWWYFQQAIGRGCSIYRINKKTAAEYRKNYKLYLYSFDKHGFLKEKTSDDTKTAFIPRKNLFEASLYVE